MNVELASAASESLSSGVWITIIMLGWFVAGIVSFGIGRYKYRRLWKPVEIHSFELAYVYRIRRRDVWILLFKGVYGWVKLFRGKVLSV